MAIYIPASVKYICCFGCVRVATFLLMCNSWNMTLKSTLTKLQVVNANTTAAIKTSATKGPRLLSAFSLWFHAPLWASSASSREYSSDQRRIFLSKYRFQPKEYQLQSIIMILDCKTVGFCFLKISKEIGKAWPFVWLLARTWIRRNMDCFAV